MAKVALQAQCSIKLLGRLDERSLGATKLNSLRSAAASADSAERPAFRLAPVGLQPAALFKPVQGRIERALLHLKYVLRYLLDSLGDSVAMYGTERYNLQDQHVQSALQ